MSFEKKCLTQELPAPVSCFFTRLASPSSNSRTIYTEALSESGETLGLSLILGDLFWETGS